VDKKTLISTMHGNQEGPKVIYCPRPPYNMSLGGTGVLHVHVHVKGYEQQKMLLLHLKEHEKISRLAV
jgi:hypothetical protein